MPQAVCNLTKISPEIPTLQLEAIGKGVDWLEVSVKIAYDKLSQFDKELFKQAIIQRYEVRKLG